jgi:integrase
MIAAGVPITVVSAQLGHANTGITATTYAHLASERDLDLAATVCCDSRVVGCGCS